MVLWVGMGHRHVYDMGDAGGALIFWLGLGWFYGCFGGKKGAYTDTALDTRGLYLKLGRKYTLGEWHYSACSIGNFISLQPFLVHLQIGDGYSDLYDSIYLPDDASVFLAK